MTYSLGTIGTKENPTQRGTSGWREVTPALLKVAELDDYPFREQAVARGGPIFIRVDGPSSRSGTSSVSVRFAPFRTSTHQVMPDKEADTGAVRRRLEASSLPIFSDAQVSARIDAAGASPAGAPMAQGAGTPTGTAWIDRTEVRIGLAVVGAALLAGGVYLATRKKAPAEPE